MHTHTHTHTHLHTSACTHALRGHLIIDTDVEHTLPVQTFGELETELGKENFIIQGNVILNAGGSVQLAVNTVKVCFFTLAGIAEVCSCVRFVWLCHGPVFAVFRHRVPG